MFVRQPWIVVERLDRLMQFARLFVQDIYQSFDMLVVAFQPVDLELVHRRVGVIEHVVNGARKS